VKFAKIKGRETQNLIGITVSVANSAKVNGHLHCKL
jgi:hypothetical protein